MSEAVKSTTTTAAGAAGTAYAGPVGGAVATQTASSLCDCCCGNSSKGEEQKAAIAKANPMTGDAEIDKQIKAQNDQAYQNWVHANDVQQFEALPASTKAQLPMVKQFVDALYAKIPEADRDMTVGEAAAKYPAIANEAWAAIQTAFPSLKGMPLDYALALAKASGADKVKLSEIKDRLDYVAANAPSAKGMSSSGMSGTTLALGGTAILVAILGGIALFRRK